MPKFPTAARSPVLGCMGEGLVPSYAYESIQEINSTYFAVISSLWTS